MGFIRKTEFASAGFSGTSIPLTVTAPVVGNALILGICTMDNVSGEKTVSSIADNGSPGSSWVKALGFDDTTHGCNIEIWYALEIKGSPTTVTLTVAGAGAAANRAACVIERDDIYGRASLVERTASQSTSGTTVTSGNTGVTSEQELAYGIYGDGNQLLKIRITAEWTERSNSTYLSGPAGFVLAERVVETGVQSVTFDATPSTTFGGVGIATFKFAIRRTASDALASLSEKLPPQILTPISGL